MYGHELQTGTSEITVALCLLPFTVSNSELFLYVVCTCFAGVSMASCGELCYGMIRTAGCEQASQEVGFPWLHVVLM